jgi:hypothetical protein
MKLFLVEELEKTLDTNQQDKIMDALSDQR